MTSLCWWYALENSSKSYLCKQEEEMRISEWISLAVVERAVELISRPPYRDLIRHFLNISDEMRLYHHQTNQLIIRGLELSLAVGLVPFFQKLFCGSSFVFFPFSYSLICGAAATHRQYTRTMSGTTGGKYAFRSRTVGIKEPETENVRNRKTRVE